MELFVLLESGDLVGVFSSSQKLVDYVKLVPVKVTWNTSPDGIETTEVVCNYRSQRVVLDEVLTDA